MVISRSLLLVGVYYFVISNLILIIDNIFWVMFFCVVLIVFGKNKRIKLFFEICGEN